MELPDDIVARKELLLERCATYRYDAEGNLVGTTDFDGSVSSYEYDGLDRLARVSYPDGTMKTFAWDAEGRLLEAENPGAFLEYAYDAAGRLSWSRDGALGEELRYGYDAEGRRTALERGADRTEWRYGLAGELLSMTDPRGGTTEYAYDAELRETARSLPNGVTTETRYDAAGRVVATIHATRAWGHEKVLPSEAYVYDDAGRKSLAVDASGRVTGYRYDAAGRLVEAAYPLTPGIAQEAFDERLSLGLFPTFEEAKPGKGPKGQTFAAPELPGLDAEAIKGFATRFEAWKGKLPGSDRSGAWKQSVDRAYLPSSTLPSDSTERLREAYGLLGARGLPQTGAPVWRETYAYDARGNRLEKRNALGAIAYAYDAENRLESAGARTYEYDANGSLVAETLSGLSVTYRYDAERRLVAASATDPLVLGKDRGASSTTAVAYAYDALGRRNARTVTGAAGKAETTVAERTLYDGLSFDALAVYVDRDGRGASRFGRPELAAEYLRANGVLVSSYARLETKDGEWRPSPARGAERYYLVDTLGSVRASLDGSGHVVDVLRYDVFGAIYEGTPDAVSRFAYTGKPLDAATGRYDYGFRDYDPRTGRFQTVDPIRDGENWYGYVGNDPVNYLDKHGLETLSAGDELGQMTVYEQIVAANYDSEKWRRERVNQAVRTSGGNEDDIAAAEGIPVYTGVLKSDREQIKLKRLNIQLGYGEIIAGIAIPAIAIYQAEAKAQAAFAVSPLLSYAVVAEEALNVKSSIVVGLALFGDGLNRVLNKKEGYDLLMDVFTPAKTPDEGFYCFSYGW